MAIRMSEYEIEICLALIRKKARVRDEAAHQVDFFITLLESHAGRIVQSPKWPDDYQDNEK